ncbi:MAG: hypothetical protein ACYCO9_07620, partial [Streptosporangiaceae bacterium]
MDQAARAALEEEPFGKHELTTDHDDRPVAEVTAGYRSQSGAGFSFRQTKDQSFLPVRHWAGHNIGVHVFTCVLALRAAHLMRLAARHAGLGLPARTMLGPLAGIGETALLYQGQRGRPRARRMPTGRTSQQRRLRGTSAWPATPRAVRPYACQRLGHTPASVLAPDLTCANVQPGTRSPETHPRPGWPAGAGLCGCQAAEAGGPCPWMVRPSGLVAVVEPS